MSTGNAVVVGAGVGGLAAAVALEQAGWRVLVLERRAADHVAGSAISLWPNALRALAALGVQEPVRHGATLSGRSGVRTPSGRWIARTDLTAAIERRFGLSLVLTHREHLLAALRDQLRSGRLNFDETATGVTLNETSVTIRTNRQEHHCDLLVIADGANSRLRDQLFPGNGQLSYAGYTTWRMLTPRVEETVEPAETWGARGLRFAVLPVADDEVYCYATANGEAGQHAADERVELMRRFGSWHRPIPQIIGALGVGDAIRTDVYEMSTPMTTYHRDRVALVGDAAHAMTPDLGQGGCQALEDAATLGALLASQPSVLDALQQYSALRVPRGADLVRRSHNAGRIFQAPATISRTVALLSTALPAGVMARSLRPVLDWQPISTIR